MEEPPPQHAVHSLGESARHCFRLLDQWKEARGLAQEQKNVLSCLETLLKQVKSETTSLERRGRLTELRRTLSIFLESSSLSKEEQVVALLRPAMERLDPSLWQSWQDLWQRVQERARLLEKISRCVEESTDRSQLVGLHRMLQPDRWRSGAHLLEQFFQRLGQEKEEVKQEKKRTAQEALGESQDAPPLKRNLRRHQQQASVLSLFTRVVQEVTEFASRLKDKQHKNEDKFDESVVCPHCPGRACRVYGNLGRSVCTQCGRMYRMSNQGAASHGYTATLGYATSGMGGGGGGQGQGLQVEERGPNKPASSWVTYFANRLRRIQVKDEVPSFPREEIEAFKEKLRLRSITEGSLLKFREQPERFFMIMQSIFDKERSSKRFREMKKEPFAALYFLLGVVVVEFTHQEETEMNFWYQELSRLTLQHSTERSNNFSMDLYLYDFMFRLGRPEWAPFFATKSEFACSDFQKAVSWAYRQLGLQPTRYQ